MGEDTTLFTSGFLGATFSWWVGQIVDDSFWRDNIAPGKHDKASQIPGWGRRYKVRIIGFHDQEDAKAPPEELPWAQVMYPVTGGGGQKDSLQTANLRQGMFVFGFFLDVEDQQTPVIMGVLGNNAKTTLSIERNNYGPQSGNMQEEKSKKGPALKNDNTVSDQGRNVEKPTQGVTSPQNEPDECAPVPAGVKLNKYGLAPNRTQSRQQLADSQAARNQGKDDGLTGQDLEDFVMKTVADKTKARCKAKKGPNAPPKPGAAAENVDDVTMQSSADVKKQDQYLAKIPLDDPYDPIGSSMKSMMIIISELMKKINKILQTAMAYVDMISDAVSKGRDICETIKSLIESAAGQLAKHMKPIFEKILEFIIKQIQTAMDLPTNMLFPNQRHMFADMKEQITKLITCIFEKIIAGLKGQILSAMLGGVDGVMGDLCSNSAGGGSSTPGGPAASNSGGTRGQGANQNEATPVGEVNRVSMCYVENLTGDIIAANREAIDEPMKKVIAKVDTFLNDMKNQIDLLNPNLVADSEAFPSIDGILGDMSGAMNFMNMKFSLFGCDLDPTPALADLYTFQNGGGATEDVDKPNPGEVSKAAAAAGTPEINEPATKDFALPSNTENSVPANASKTVDQTGQQILADSNQNIA